ncbi:hypothetical protein AWB68_05762 [Caballeronia choica]|uniref:Uncharacterized protein n=1 Tax=Caballeronia choica TaxID=326476 RepID=A0A158KG59_9BURK|nr:hypothetical protein AWB68_05762 [Caballeronia choica]
MLKWRENETIFALHGLSPRFSPAHEGNINA